MRSGELLGKSGEVFGSLWIPLEIHSPWEVVGTSGGEILEVQGVSRRGEV